MKKFVQIAIDGPAAAGKSTIAKIVAAKLGFVYVDTGAMYRATAWNVINNNVDENDEFAVNAALAEIKVTLAPGGIVLVNEIDVTDAIRELPVTTLVPKVATYESVRNELKVRQETLANTANVIMDGRDIGTNVLPNADYKFFMIADAKVRANRRYQENLTRGITTPVDELELEIIKRDTMDANREHAPLKQAEDAILIDTSYMSIDEVVENIVNTVKGA